MISDIFLKLEIVLLLLSVVYIFYYIIYFWIIKRIIFIRNSKIKQDESDYNALKLHKNETNINNNINKVWKISEKDLVNLEKIIKHIERNIKKRFFDIAKNLIVEWFSIDKNNKQLNLYLAHIYIIEKNYNSAVFIYEDLVKSFPTDKEIQKLLEDTNIQIKTSN
jgi:hypothetical protein